MKIRIRMAVLVALLSVSLSANAYEDIVTTVAQFRVSLASNHDIHLAADLNLSGFETITSDYSGTIDGQTYSYAEDGTMECYALKNASMPILQNAKGATFKNLVVSGMNIDESSADALGLIENATGATFSHVVVENATLHGDNNVGALVGISSQCRYEDVAIRGKVAIQCDDNNAGALVGSSSRDVLVNVVVETTGKGSTINCDNYNAAGLVGSSTGSSYTDIIVRGFQKISAMDNVVGGVTGASSGDTFVRCLSSGNYIFSDGDGYNAYAGGIAGTAVGSTFDHCTNSSWVVGDDNYVGGITSLATRCTFTDCCNTDTIQHLDPTSSDDYVGGIAAYAKGCTFRRCINHDIILCGDESAGGICGYATADNGKNTLFADCLNTADITTDDEYVGGIVGHLDHGTVTRCLNTAHIYGDVFGYMVGDKGEGVTISDCCFKPVGQQYDSSLTSFNAELTTGEACWILNGRTDANTTWRQNLTGTDKDSCPVPDATHDVVSPYVLPKTYHISTAEELVAFTTAMTPPSGGGDTHVVAFLENDIDMSGCGWKPIGDAYHVFKGYFNGQGHVIDNLTYTGAAGRLGLFGTIGVGAVIRDVILGAGSSISSSSTDGSLGGVAGIVGCASGSGKGVVTISGCGNEAAISAPHLVNVAGILGAVYQNYDIRVRISGCYNTGTITGSKDCASICACIRDSAIVSSCYNMGKVYGTAVGKEFVSAGNGCTLTNCFEYIDSGNDNQDGNTLFDLDDLTSGAVCYMMNDNHDEGPTVCWQQNLNSDARPMPGDRGLYCVRPVKSRYGTITLPFATCSDEQMQLYTLSDQSTDDELVITAIDTLAAGTPALFAVEEGADSVMFSSIDTENTDDFYELNPVTVGDWTLYGTLRNYSPLSLTGVYYIASNQFWYAEKPVTVGNYRAWMTHSDGRAAATVTLRTDDGTTFIRPAELSEETSTFSLLPSNFYYDLLGRRVENPDRGIYIHGGKKVMVR